MDTNTLTKEDVSNTLVFLGRASLNGTESDAMTLLKLKFNNMLKNFDAPKEAQKVEKAEESTSN